MSDYTDALERLPQYNVSGQDVPFTFVGEDGYGYVLEWPRALSDVATVINGQTQLVATGVRWISELVHLRATGNVDLTNGLEDGDTLNGVTLVTGMNVFLPAQSAGATTSFTLSDGTVITDSPTNGIYTVVASGAASRATFANEAAELAGMAFLIEQGTYGRGERWTLSLAAGDITVDTTQLPFSRVMLERTDLAYPSIVGTTTALTQAAREGRRLTLEDFGAKCDGTTDDTTAFEAAVNFFQTDTDVPYGGRILIPGPTRLTDTIQLLKGSRFLEIAGEGLHTRIIGDFSSEKHAFYVGHPSTAGGACNVEFHNMLITGDPDYTKGFDLENANLFRLSNVRLETLLKGIDSAASYDCDYVDLCAYGVIEEVFHASSLCHEASFIRPSIHNCGVNGGTDHYAFLFEGSGVNRNVSFENGAMEVVGGLVRSTIGHHGFVFRGIETEQCTLPFFDFEAAMVGFDISRNAFQSGLTTPIDYLKGGEFRGNFFFDQDFTWGSNTTDVSSAETVASGTSVLPLEFTRSFTPYATFSTNGDFAPTYSSQVGKMIKRGQVVTFWITLTFTCNAYTTASGAFLIGGLPHPCRNDTNYAVTISRSAKLDLSANARIGAEVFIDSNVIAFYESIDNGTSAALATTNVPAGATDVSINLCGTYLTDDAS
ncbi:MAG: hypothetical protein M9944_08105 [Rhizobiaceae bacterium]|nr:hypothetical protein [Rhizobiaceae bacterium]